jgi:hypothetical protein
MVYGIYAMLWCCKQNKNTDVYRFAFEMCVVWYREKRNRQDARCVCKRIGIKEKKFKTPSLGKRSSRGRESWCTKRMCVCTHLRRWRNQIGGTQNWSVESRTTLYRGSIDLDSLCIWCCSVLDRYSVMGVDDLVIGSAVASCARYRFTMTQRIRTGFEDGIRKSERRNLRKGDPFHRLLIKVVTLECCLD